jgi:SAM-dependent methyltransferase
LPAVSTPRTLRRIVRASILRERAPAAPVAGPVGPAGDLARAVPAGYLAHERAPVTAALLERLGPELAAELDARMREEEAVVELPGAAPGTRVRDIYSWAAEQDRGRLLLHFALALGVPGVLERSGLRLDEPPRDVHAMARGALATGGGLYEADMIADALASIGRDIAGVEAGLDFGCSSGRVVRALAAAFPEARWHGCDPNAPAIEWARGHFPEIDFAVSTGAPPLALPDQSLDLVYAISVWSHFAPGRAREWLIEMARLLRPGGVLVLTAHGATTIAFEAASGRRTPEQLHEIRESLYREGAWYRAEFGSDGDWGVVDPDWGTSFLTPEWFLVNACPTFHVAEFAPGRNAGNQDVYALVRA